MHSTIPAVLFFILALLTGIFAFTGMDPGAARDLARFFFFLFAALFIVTAARAAFATWR